MLVGTLLGNRQRTVSVKGMRLGERLMNSLNCCTVSFRPIPALWSSNSYLTMNWWTLPVRGFAVEADVAPSDLDRARCDGRTWRPHLESHGRRVSPDGPSVGAAGVAAPGWAPAMCPPRQTWTMRREKAAAPSRTTQGKDHRAPLKLDQPVAPLLDVRSLPVVSPARRLCRFYEEARRRMGWRGRLVFRLPRLPVGVIRLLLLETKRNNEVTLHLWLRTAQPAELRGISDGAVKKKRGISDGKPWVRWRISADMVERICSSEEQLLKNVR
jgi:hypothetical protein